MAELTLEEKLDRLQALVSGNIKENTPPEDEGWMTLSEWHELLNKHGRRIGYNKLRKTLMAHGEVFEGTQCRDGRLGARNQVWYRIDFNDI